MHRYSLLGKTIKDVRKELGLTQKELADKLGVTRHTVLHWEQSLHAPYPYHVEQITAIYGSDNAQVLTLERQDRNDGS